MADLIPLKRALISVSDKEGLIPFAKALADRGVDIISTGGTAKTLREAKIASRDVSDLTGFPEMMDGRVKTLHPKVHGGLLALRGNIEHQMAMDTHKILPIDLLVVNLYPFEDTIAGGADYDTAVENIDIGGPAMIRAAAKNHAYVAVVTDVEDYDALLAELDENDGQTRLAFRQTQALTAYGRTSAYDAAISTWMADALETPSPRRRTFGGTMAQQMRYGENPHQAAAFYTDGSSAPSVATAHQHQGKELSYNNINDTDAAFALASEFDPDEGCACVIVKHANPCGVAVAATMEEAYQKAFDCDRTSAFGGIVAFNRQLDRETAEKIADVFTEVVIAPGLLPGAHAALSEKKNLRLLTTDGMADPAARGLSVRQVGGGWLVQDRDTAGVTMDDLETVSKRVPVMEEYRDLLFAWKVAKHVKSNAIVFAKGEATVGIGAGQMSRVDSTRIAARKAQDMADALGLSQVPTEGASVASDAFFPFPDGIEALAEAGARAVIQPGGSMRDEDVIARADELDLAMVFTRQRHFRH